MVYRKQCAFTTSTRYKISAGEGACGCCLNMELIESWNAVRTAVPCIAWNTKTNCRDRARSADTVTAQ